ncbi:MAG: 5-formyltetrahydrofolate cyclo-ligase [Frankiaceae bacterium]
MIRATKRALRGELLARRSTRAASHRDDLGALMAVSAMEHPRLAAAGRVCGYVGIGDEPPTRPLLNRLRRAGVEVLLPILAPERTLDWARYDGFETLIRGPHGLLQPGGDRLGPAAPVTADLLLVPALAVDAAGTRLGRGGGYYDRLLARLAGGRQRPVLPDTWAVVYDEEVLDRVPREPHDVPVSGVITPSTFRRLR